MRAGRGLTAVVIATAAVAVPFSATPTTTATQLASPRVVEIGHAAASATAERLDPPARRLESLVVVGDSLSYMAGWPYNTGGATLAGTLLAAGWARVHVDARSGRSTWYPSNPLLSGVHAVQRLKVAGHAPDAWLVQLGTNDVWFVQNCGCPDVAAFARQRIVALLDAIGDGSTVYWVNVRRWSNTAAQLALNDVLHQLVAEGRIAAVVDWHALSAGKKAVWFVDSSHLTHAGYRAWLGEIWRVVQP